MAKRGKWSQDDKNFLSANYLLLTDQQIANRLDRTRASVTKTRERMKLTKATEPKKDIEGQYRGSYISGLSQGDKESFLLAELKRTAQFKQTKAVLQKHEIEFYQERYMDFMMDPTIETMTSAEKDTLHRKTLAEVRLLRFMAEEKRALDSFNAIELNKKLTDQEKEEQRKWIANKSKEIGDCNSVIKECEKSLNVTREQRLKNSSDQAVNFTTLIKDLQNPTIRSEVGNEAAMFRWMTRKDYNEKIGKRIHSGKNDKYDTNLEFKSGVEPSGLSNDFTGDGSG